jgi:hypothetical protein
MEHAKPIEEYLAAGEEVVPRTTWFYFGYDWQSREKQVFLNEPSEDLQRSLVQEGKWHHLYKLQVELPVPAEVDERTEIRVSETADLRVEVMLDAKDYAESERLSYAFARRLYGITPYVIPATRTIKQTNYTWKTNLDEKGEGPHVFIVERDGQRLRVTVEEL